MSEEKFKMGEAIKFGWETMKENIWFFIPLLIVAFLIKSVPGAIAQYAGAEFPVISFILLLTGWVLSFVVDMGLVKISLQFCDGIKGKLDDLLSSFDILLPFIAASIIYMLIIFAGVMLFVVPCIIFVILNYSIDILLQFNVSSIIYRLIGIALILLSVVPGIILAIKFSLYPYFIVEKKLGPIEALKASSRAAKGAKWDLLLFWMLLGLINVAGALVLLVGLFATIPISMVAYAYVYRRLAEKLDPPGLTYEV